MQNLKYIIALSLLALASCATSTPVVDDGASSLRLPTSKELADRMIEKFENATYLKLTSIESAFFYDAEGLFQSLEEAGDAAWYATSHVGYGETEMRPAYFCFKGWRGTEPIGKPLVIVQLKDGMITEKQWRPAQHDYEEATYEPTRYGGIGDMTLQSYFYQQGVEPDTMVCNFAIECSTWLGKPSPMNEHFKPGIVQSTLLGEVEHNGRTTYLLKVSHKDATRSGGLSFSDGTFWIDKETDLIVRWTSERGFTNPKTNKSGFVNYVREYRYEFGPSSTVVNR